MEKEMKKNEEIILYAEKMIDRGICLGRYEGKVVLIEGCLPNELVKVRIIKSKSNYAEAETIEIIEKSNARREAICKYFGLCGGCKLQNMIYEEQLKVKKSFVEESLRRIGKIENPVVNEPIPADDEYFYRNKMEYSFAKRWLFKDVTYDEREKEFALGLHIPNRYEKVINLDYCYLQSDFSNQIRNFIGKYLFDKKVSIHSLKNKPGLLKALAIRESRATEQKMINLITTRFEKQLMEELTKEIISNFPTVTTFVNSISSENLSSTLSNEFINLYGECYIIEKLFNYEFEIYPNTFFQTNTKQAEKLFSVVKEYFDSLGMKANKENSLLIDLYSGVGVLGIIFSKYFEKVICYEEVEESIISASKNAKRNNINNIEFIRIDLNKGFNIPKEFKNKKITVVVDPPRAGMSKETINSILQLNPERIVYISCNPATQARDLTLLKEKYFIKTIQPVDLFPQTYHIENILVLEIF